ncbi:MAG: hypothetical protein OEU26_10840 [Candidatus Tectomicrobia bacterium]|nr:hypothetical protein [Candidatus Tectomicrobia bacterium]
MSDGRISRGLAADDVDQALDHRPRNGVEALGPVERHRGDIVIPCF